MKPEHFKETINGHSFWMKYIPGGTFDMGDEHGDLWEACRPVQKGIEISAFYMAEYPVTQALWKAVMGEENNPSYFMGDNRPVEQVSWDDAQEFLEKLNRTDTAKKRHDMDGLKYRLSSEAQWEYAARSGKNNPNEKYVGSTNLKEVGWFSKNSHGETKPVGLKLSNEFGLFDMSGNVFEWCEDAWYENLNGTDKNGKPRYNEKETGRVIRGGSWYNFNLNCRVALRNWNLTSYRGSDIGCRISRY